MISLQKIINSIIKELSNYKYGKFTQIIRRGEDDEAEPSVSPLIVACIIIVFIVVYWNK